MKGRHGAVVEGVVVAVAVAVAVAVPEHETLRMNPCPQSP